MIVDSYLHQVLDVGTFHADPHQGNILVSHGKPYWIDFGMIGHVTDKDIDLIQDAVKALLIQDADSLVNAVMGMGAASEKTDRTMLGLWKKIPGEVFCLPLLRCAVHRQQREL